MRDDSTCEHHQRVNTKIRLIIFVADEDGEALYSQQKQDWELTVDQIINWHMTARAGRQRAISAPETSILHQTVSRLPVANHVFLISWTADICQEGCSLRSAPQRRHLAHLRWCSSGAPRKSSGQDQGGD